MNALVELLVALLRVTEVLGSNLGSENCYRDLT
jgi:hypothetical protein